MKFTAATIAFFLSLAVALPESAPLGMVQKLDSRDIASMDKIVFGRSFSCPSNDPDTCCACRGGFGTCINGICSCNGGDC